jgi:enoyl-CoA hydratase/carnithine racemase
LLQECRQVAADIASCVPETVKVYKQMVNEGLETTLGAGQAMERSVMGHVNKRVPGDAIAARRSGVQQRGQSQKSS